MVLSLLLPLLKVEYFTIETDSRFLLLLNQFNQNSSQKLKILSIFGILEL